MMTYTLYVSGELHSESRNFGYLLGLARGMNGVTSEPVASWDIMRDSDDVIVAQYRSEEPTWENAPANVRYDAYGEPVEYEDEDDEESYWLEEGLPEIDQETYIARVGGFIAELEARGNKLWIEDDTEETAPVAPPHALPTVDHVIQADEMVAPAPFPVLWTQYVASDHKNKGEWERALVLARALMAAGLWSGNRRLYIHDPQTCADELALYDTLPCLKDEGDALVARPFREGVR